jgi:hypothetical protein
VEGTFGNSRAAWTEHFRRELLRSCAWLCFFTGLAILLGSQKLTQANIFHGQWAHSISGMPLCRKKSVGISVMLMPHPPPLF